MGVARLRGAAWLPMAVALLLVASRAPTGVVEPSDAATYLAQGRDLARFDVPSGRYPPGLGLVLAFGEIVGLDPWQTVKLVALGLVVLVVVAARRLGGPTAGFVAGALCCVSPWLLGSGRYVVSDPLASLLAVAGLLAVTARRPGWAAVSAVAGVLVRLFSVVGVVALLAVGRRWAAGALVAVVVLVGGFQWAASGSPLHTGYEGGGAKWAPRYVVDQDRTGDGTWIVEGGLAKSMTPATAHRSTPNALAYPVAIFGFVYLPPLVAGVGLWALWRRRQTAAARFVGWWLAGSLAVVLPYFFQSPRFLAPAMMLVLVYAAVGVTDLLGDLVDRHPGDVERGVPLDVERTT